MHYDGQPWRIFAFGFFSLSLTDHYEIEEM